LVEDHVNAKTACAGDWKDARSFDRRRNGRYQHRLLRRRSGSGNRPGLRASPAERGRMDACYRGAARSCGHPFGCFGIRHRPRDRRPGASCRDGSLTRFRSLRQFHEA